ncbi:MAG: hypothetical protein OEV59_07720 [Deltaproteobacteria bacterium]|nr:hypothetical protein [Deltaproteobacteria bacterium]
MTSRAPLKIKSLLLLTATALFSACIIAVAPEPLKAEDTPSKTFTFTVTKKLPRYTVVVKFRSEGPATRPILAPDSLDIYRAGASKPVQSYHEVSLDMRAVSPETKADEIFGTYDINFDGYNDLYYASSFGTPENNTVIFWIFKPRKGKFVRDENFELTNYSVDRKLRRITETWHIGTDPYAYQKVVSEVRGRRPITLFEETQEWVAEKDSGYYLRIISRKIGKKLVPQSSRKFSRMELEEEKSKQVK